MPTTTERSEVFDLPILRADVPLGDVTQSEDGHLMVDLVWTAGALVKRYDYWADAYYWEELSLEDGHVNLERLNNGAPLLDSHRQYAGVGAILGVIEDGSAVIENGEGTATIKVSNRAELEGLRQDLKDGIVRKVSLGARIHKFEKTEAGPEGLPLYRAIDWEPHELSLVGVPADDAAQVTATSERSGDRSELETFPCEIIVRAATEETESMPKKVEKTVTPAPDEVETTRAATPAPAPVVEETPQADVTAIERAAVKKERSRVTRIESVAAGLKVSDEVKRHCLDEGLSVEDAQTHMVDSVVKRSEDEPGTTHGARVQITLDEMETRRDAAVDFLVHRGNRNKYDMPDAARDMGFQRMNLLRLTETCLDWKGESHRNMSTNEMIHRAMTGTDLPYIVEAAVSKVLLDGYQEIEPTFMPFCRRVDLPDFKSVNRVALGEVPTLTKHKDGAETKRTSLTDEKETWSIDEYREMLQITRQTIINDDMDAFSRIPQMMADAARRMEADVVWAIITANAAMADAVTLFHANHNNYNSTGTAPSHASLGAARKTMRKQVGRDGTTKIDVRPQYILAPVALEHALDQIMHDATLVLSSDRSEVKTSKVGQLIPITEPRLDDTSAVNWYLSADPSTIDTIEYGSLEGTDGPSTTSQVNFDTGGLDIKVLEDFGAKAIDHRGMFKQKGV